MRGERETGSSREGRMTRQQDREDQAVAMKRGVLCSPPVRYRTRKGEHHPPAYKKEGRRGRENEGMDLVTKV